VFVRRCQRRGSGKKCPRRWRNTNKIRTIIDILARR